MADQVRYVPMDLVFSASQLRSLVADEAEADRITRLVEKAYSQGYHEGYLRGIAEENAWNQLRQRRERAAMKAPNPPTPEVPGA